ncbi:hypothetical protein MRX96_048403 [Rhipicephalus microplus]
MLKGVPNVQVEAQVSFLGHRIEDNGLHPLQDNLEAVLAVPKTASQLADSTNDYDLLRQVNTWILHGWPQQLGQEQHGFLPYFNHTHELTDNTDSRQPVDRRDDARFSAKDLYKRTFYREGGPGPSAKAVFSSGGACVDTPAQSSWPEIVTRHSDGIKRQALGHGGHHRRNAVPSLGPTVPAAPHSGGKAGALHNPIFSATTPTM